MFNKSVTPLVVVFLVVALVILFTRTYLQQYNINWQVLSGANLFLYLVTMASLHLLTGGMKAANTQLFLRKAYSGILLKLFGCAGAAFVYILVAGKNLNKNALLISMGLYLLYSFIENRIVLKESQQKKDA